MKRAAKQVLIVLLVVMAVIGTGNISAQADYNWKPKKVSIAQSAKKVSQGKEFEIRAKVTPIDAEDDYIRWEIISGKKYVKLNAGESVGVQGKKAFRYMGIPYGGAKRGSAPTAVSSWQGIKKCTKARKAKGDNALFLNVYRPKNLSKAVPVMVFLHGGGNVGGTPNMHFSTFVDETDVIVVSVEFRQGAFG